MQNKVISFNEKLKKVYGGNPWYGDSVKSVLKNIDPRTAFTKASGNTHTIAELVSHIIGWREFALARLKGDKNFRMIQKTSFDWRKKEKDEETAWKTLLSALEKNQKEILAILKRSDDDLLSLPVHRRKYNMEFLIEGFIQHDLYHLGQISLLKKMIRGKK